MSFLARTAPFLAAGLMLALAPLAHGQTAPSPQNAGFALADQIRAGRTASVTYATTYQQQQQLAAMNEAQAQAAMQQAAGPTLSVEPTPEGGFVMEGPVFGPGLVSPAAGGPVTNNISLQITVQNGSGNSAINSTANTTSTTNR